MQPSHVPVQPTPPPKRRRARVVGLLGLVVGLAAAAATWFLAGQRYDDAVADLAPAPVGCATTLVFDKTGTYTFYVETSGTVGALDGDCGTADRDYEFEGDGLPRVSLTLLDDGGDEVDLDRVDRPSYDAGGAQGVAVRTADVEEAGEYTLTVAANAEDVVVRVGRDPSDGVSTMRTVAVALALIGLGCGAIALAAGRRRPPTAPVGPSGQAAWQPNPTAPVAPPDVRRPGEPPYAWGPTTPAGPPPPSRQPPPPPQPQPGWPPGPGGRPLPPPGQSS